MIWRCRTRSFDLSSRVLVMGVLNVTPDSFSDGGKFLEPEAAAERAFEMQAEGADIIDIGGESTRPGAEPVTEAEELRRVLPVLERVAPKIEAALSIDTRRAEVARAALEAGAVIVNDVTALRNDEAMAPLVAETGAGIVLMHMQGEPRTMQTAPCYEDVVDEVKAFLLEREAAAASHGIQRDRIAFDPGIGFGKTLEHNLEIFRRMEKLSALGRPLLVGPSRKTFGARGPALRRVLGLSEGSRVDPASAEVRDATAAAVAAAVLRGASIVRVHDVKSMKRIADVARAVR